MTDKILMCRPDYYGIKYEINPWMNMNIQADNTKAKLQWENLYSILKDRLKAEIALVEPKEDVPDMVFTANAAVMYGKKAIMSRFRYKERQKEEKYYGDWFEANGYQTVWMDDSIAFEGAGDALYLKNILFSGYIPRTDIKAHNWISQYLGIEVISLELVNKSFYHIDTCFCPLESDYLIYYPDAFDYWGNKVIERYVPEEKRIIVNEEEASYFTCNAVNIGKNVVTNLTTKRFSNLLKEKGFHHIQTDMSEFMKAGGASKCLTLKI